MSQSEGQVRTCPVCDYRGDAEICPVDGEVTVALPEPLAGNTDSPAARAPTMAGDSLAPAAVSAHSLELPQLSASIPKAGTDDVDLRGTDFGQWAAPEVTQKKNEMIGRSVGGRYTISGTLGRGGMGTVYLADQPSVQRTVAIKVLHREYAENPSIVRRFHQEAMAASRLNHPHTISVYDFGQSDGLLYIAMEHLRGQTLHEATQTSGGLSIERSLRIMRQVLKSVGEAHHQGVIHRDLKPENIFLTQMEGEVDFVKVLDFGVAKLKQPDEEQQTLTQAGTVFGTPRYMAPEQSRDVPLDHRVDLYSLGIILYEMLMGRVPFDSDNPLGVLLAQSNVVPPRFSELRPELEMPEVVEAVVFKALAKAPEQRYQTAFEMAADIDRLLDGLQAGTLRTETEQYPELRRALLAAGAELAQVEDSWTDTLSAPELAPPRSSGGLGIIWILAVTAVLFAVVLWVGHDATEQAEKPQEPSPSVTASTPTLAESAPDAGQAPRKRPRIDTGTPQPDAAPPRSTPRPGKRIRPVRRVRKPQTVEVVVPPSKDVRIERKPMRPAPVKMPANAVDEADTPSELM